MVSQSSPSHSSILHQFIISDSNQNQFENHQFDVYGSTVRGNSSTFPPQPQPTGLLPSIQSLGERMSRSVDLGESGISHTRHLMDLLGASSEANHQARGLSLSLNSNMLVPPDPFRQRQIIPNVQSSYNVPSQEVRGACSPGTMGHMGDAYSYLSSPFANAIGNSRYLRAAQSLLEEIVNIHGKDFDLSYEDFMVRSSSGGGRRVVGLSSELKAELCNNGFMANEKQELHIKIAKLIALLEEVENRYQRYQHQMEEVASSFEAIAGLGSAKCYTSLALQAMSRHFCSLSNAITSQINSTKRKMHDSPKPNSGLSHLNLFDQEGRNGRLSLQQLGLIQRQRQAWRPIRGLPDTSVAVLRAWLFEHFLHPYPTDSEKLMLASQTGLSKNQVSNWFINARVRLWKPMIEEMYKEEFADSPDPDPLAAGGSMIGESNPDYVEE